MLKLSAILVIIWATVGAALASSLTGSFAWVNGTLTGSVTGNPSPQTVSLKVGPNTYSYPGCIVGGTSTYSVGTAFTLLLKNSRPFAAVYSANSVLLMPNDASDVEGRVYVPMTSSGFISNTIGFPSGNNPYLTLHFPPCTVGALNFSAGMQVMLNTTVTSYNVTVPTPGVPTLGSAVFVPGTVYPLNFTFSAVGNGSLTVVGAGNVTNLAIAASSIGVATKFTTGSLHILRSTFG